MYAQPVSGKEAYVCDYLHFPEIHMAMCHDRHFNDIHDGLMSSLHIRSIAFVVLLEAVSFLCVDNPCLKAEVGHVPEHLAISRIHYPDIVGNRQEPLLHGRVPHDLAQSDAILDSDH